jgi:diguanylate cyclase (GGDEF)-like protein
MKKSNYFKSVISKSKKTFLRLNIANKMLLGFLPLFVLFILMAVFALTNLNRLNRINKSIVQVDIPLIQATERMVERLYSQELHGNRYVILKSPQKMELFSSAGMEFKNQIVSISGLPGIDKTAIERLSTLHDEYNSLFMEWFQYTDNGFSIQKDYGKLIAEKQKDLIELLQEISSRASSELNEKMLAATDIGLGASRIFVAFCLISIFIGIGVALLITKNISGAIIRLKNATKEISKGNFDFIPDIRNQDELGELSHSFSEMAKRLKRLEEMYLDTSPLTRLPGGIAIENVIRKRINRGALFAFCLVDLDNFKVFNDHYGYARGNKVLKHTARIIEKAAKKHGTEETFIGHIGGDDFVIITSIDHYDKICDFIVKEFDKTVHKFYDSKDFSLGSIIHKSRTGEELKFPIMTISIGVVSNKMSKFRHFVQVGELAAEVKNYAKTELGSVYIVDRRKRSS